MFEESDFYSITCSNFLGGTAFDLFAIKKDPIGVVKMAVKTCKFSKKELGKDFEHQFTFMVEL